MAFNAPHTDESTSHWTSMPYYNRNPPPGSFVFSMSQQYTADWSLSLPVTHASKDEALKVPCVDEALSSCGHLRQQAIKSPSCYQYPTNGRSVLPYPCPSWLKLSTGPLKVSNSTPQPPSSSLCSDVRIVAIRQRWVTKYEFAILFAFELYILIENLIDRTPPSQICRI
jgi:hypothetical protein